MFTLPNYMKLSGPVGDSAGIDVGALFANDEDAAEFWGECLDDWLEHVRKRRAALGKSENVPAWYSSAQQEKPPANPEVPGTTGVTPETKGGQS